MFFAIKKRLLVLVFQNFCLLFAKKKGEKGDQGESGADGKDGLQGAKGEAGEKVQLCLMLIGLKIFIHVKFFKTR